MKKINVLVAIFMMASSHVFSQAIATDFTTNDCNGNSHHLFSTLDSGNVVVLAWVMPCEFCVDGAKAGWNAKQVFETSHPGKVSYYLISDFGDDSCSVLINWANANNIPVASLYSFENVGKPINMNDYGTGGMPKVVVIGNMSHYVYFNENFSAANNFVAIKNAIAEALVGNTPTNIRSVEQENQQITLQVSQGILSIPQIGADEMYVINSLGQHIHHMKISNTMNSISVGSFNNGMYMVKLFGKGRLLGNGKFMLSK